MAEGGDEEENANMGGRALVQGQQGGRVYWQRFLHVTSIKVLVVESDDSTRHLVAALLRNCNYEVIEAGNGLQAWRVLEDLANHIDLVLTELEMPRVSGVGLLCKIMTHKTRKNVPVIMMSTHDSIGLVVECLSKGAVDFLVKPIRKNELKNLWQHLWRRCQSSSGSGSETGAQTQNSVKSKSVSGNNGTDDDETVSGTQSFRTKEGDEVDISETMSLRNQNGRITQLLNQV